MDGLDSEEMAEEEQEWHGWTDEQFKEMTMIVVSDLLMQHAMAVVRGDELAITASWGQAQRLMQDDPSETEKFYIRSFVAGWAGCKIFYEAYNKEE